MFNDLTIETDDYWIEGFETSSNGLEIQVRSGVFKNDVQSRDQETGELTTVTVSTPYSAFAFDVVSDLDFDVRYNVYLLETPSDSGAEVVVDSHLITYDSVPAYEGTDTLRYNLMSFIIPAGELTHEGFDAVDIEVRRVVKRREENSGTSS